MLAMFLVLTSVGLFGAHVWDIYRQGKRRLAILRVNTRHKKPY